MIPIIITAKAAEDHLNKIRMEHANILTGIDNQKILVDQYNQNQQVEREKQEVKQEKLSVRSAQASKDQLEHDRKMKELEIKSAALSME